MDNQESLTIIATLFGVIYNLVLSMKLLMLGNLSASGATKRQAIEAVALSLLFSKYDLPNKNSSYLQNFWKGKFSVHKAVDLLYNNRKKLKLHKNALKLFKEHRNFYHNFSHHTFLAMGEYVGFDGSACFLGSSFDETKLEFYKKEIASRIGLASILDNVFDGVTNHMREWPCFAKLDMKSDGYFLSNKWPKNP
jgi:hypothetical protein